MTIKHHPNDSMLVGFAAGTLDRGQRVAIATHVTSCARCHAIVRTMEQVGGAMLADLPPAEMSSGALARAVARLSEPSHPIKIDVSPVVHDVAIRGLPKFVNRYPLGEWQWIAPRVHVRRIVLPEPSETRVFLLKSGPGTRMLEHSHDGLELTCVLSGSFKHDGGNFGPGDFDIGDETVDHRPVVNEGEDCICLVAMQGELRLNGLLGRIIQPFVRL
jgi:putative transcriptional regulator